MRRVTLEILLLALLFTITLQQNSILLTDPGYTGVPLRQLTCNSQTIINFKFNSSSIMGTANSSGTNLGYSNLTFLDSAGNELFMPLTAASFDSSANTRAFVTGYTVDPTIAAAAVFQFTSGVNNVYVYIPFTTTTTTTNPSVVDLTLASAPSNSLNTWSGTAALSPFNFFDLTDYNQFYTAVIGTDTVLISSFVYAVSSVGTAQSSAYAPASTLTGLSWTTAVVASTGSKLCYGSQTFQTHMRESVALWFIWFLIFIYWLFYLFTDSTTKSVFNKQKYTQNKITAWSLYSITQLAHEEFFTRLSRMTVILLQWTIQGVFIAAIISGAYTTGPAVMIWSAIIAEIITAVFPFIWGNVFLHKIYKRTLLKYLTKKKMMECKDKQKIQQYEKRIDNCNQKLFGYFHWYYCVAFMVFWICWPITIDRLTGFPRDAYQYNWYWLAAMAIVFVLEYFIVEPLLICFLGHTQAIKRRGGFWYDPTLGEAYSEISQN